MVIMEEPVRRSPVVWSHGGGEDGPVLVLLHGSGATGAVWDQVLAALPRSQRRVVVDLPGHGRSAALPHYSTGAMAAAIAGALDLRDTHVLVGHSLGGQVGLAMTDPLFGLRVDAVLAMSVKMDWSAAEIEKRAQRALAPRKVFPDRAGAMAMFSRIAGFADSGSPPDEAQLATGVIRVEGGFALAQDPRHGAVPPLPPGRTRALAAAAPAAVRAMCGDADPMTGPAALAPLGAVDVVAGAGHNPHLTHPAEVARVITEQLAAGARASARGPAGG
jgi:pimeloyl-ACP methyl ester carboxylesterase